MPQDKRIGYAVVGMGTLAEAAILPAFANSSNSQLVALVTGNPQNGKKLARQFHASVRRREGASFRSPRRNECKVRNEEFLA
jgi:predicted dehydrogenase